MLHSSTFPTLLHAGPATERSESFVLPESPRVDLEPLMEKGLSDPDYGTDEMFGALTATDGARARLGWVGLVGVVRILVKMTPGMAAQTSPERLAQVSQGTQSSTIG